MKQIVKRAALVVGVILLFAMIIFSPRIAVNAPANRILSTSQDPEGSSLAVSTDSSFQLRMPTSYDIEAQPITTFGDISRLATEDLAMLFMHDAIGSTASTYAIFTISTAGLPIDDSDTLIMSWEAWGVGGPEPTFTQQTSITVYLLFQTSQWLPIYTVTTPEDDIDWSNGWGNYTLPASYGDYIAGNALRVKIEIASQLTQPMSWTQWLYVNWLGLEFQQNVGVNRIAPSSVTILSPGVTSSGNVTAINLEDRACYQVLRNTPSGESRHIQVQLSFDLGLYSLGDIYGVRLSHADWVSINGACMKEGNIFVLGDQGNQFLCLTRDFVEGQTTPEIYHATFPLVGNWSQNGCIQLLYDFEYTVYQPCLVSANLDWACLEIVRNPETIVYGEVLNSTIYAGQEVWLNITCLDGKATIAEILLAPWNDTVGTAAGTYLYSKLIPVAGTILTSLFVTDSEDNVYELPLLDIVVLHRPVSVALFLSEDPLLQEVVIQLYLKDIFSNTPLPLHQFTKTIYKNGVWFRQQNHQTTLSGTFEVHEYVLDYLDWTYMVEITTAETPVYEATTVSAAITLVKCPPYIYVDGLTYEAPLKANDPIGLDYTILCQTAVDHLYLYRNGTLIKTIPTSLGSHSTSFQDIGGYWQYLLYANNTRGYQGYALPFYLNITPLETRLELESLLNIEDHAIFLEIQLFDELNRTCPNVPLTVTIYDFDKPFYEREIATGMDGVQLIVHFDRYLDHAFTLVISSESTPLYAGAITTEQDLTYEGYPLYSIVALGVTVGCVSVALAIIRRRVLIR